MSNQPSPWGNSQFGPGSNAPNPYGAPQYSGKPYPPNTPPGDGRAVAALIIGIVGLVAWCCPLVGFPLSIVGVVLGILSMKSQNPSSRTMAIIGLGLSVLSLLLTIGNAILGVIIQLNPNLLR